MAARELAQAARRSDPAAGDQSQCGVVGVAIDDERREVVLGYPSTRNTATLWSERRTDTVSPLRGTPSLKNTPSRGAPAQPTIARSSGIVRIFTLRGTCRHNPNRVPIPGRIVAAPSPTPSAGVRQTLALTTEVLSNSATARRLEIGEGTVESVCAQVFCKLGRQPDPDANRRVLAVARPLVQRR
jgi:hypothetical protein